MFLDCLLLDVTVIDLMPIVHMDKIWVEIAKIFEMRTSRGGGSSVISAVYPANCRSPRTRANSGELERTRANSARIRHRFANIDTPPNSGERSPEYAERSPEFGGVRPSSPVLRRELANGSPENSFA